MERHSTPGAPWQVPEEQSSSSEDLDANTLTHTPLPLARNLQSEQQIKGQTELGF